jgi:hypothetical protein
MASSVSIQRRSDISSAEPRGLAFFLWRLVWPVVRRFVTRRPGTLGLVPPEAPPHGDADVWVWWNAYIWNSVRRVIGTGRGEITVFSHLFVAIFVGLLGFLLLPMWDVARGLWLHGSEATLASTALFGALVSLGVVVFVIYVFGVGVGYLGYVALRSLAPDEYAAIALSGQTVSRVMRALAYEMHVACESFCVDSSGLQRLLQAAMDSKSPPDYLGSRLADCGRHLKEFNERRTGFEESLQRLLALARHGAAILDVPQRRLCDHILQYNPDTHRSLAVAYFQQWDSALRVLADDPAAAGIGEAIATLARRCQALQTNFEHRKAALRDLLRSTELHEHIHRIASRHSTSGAVVEYSKALAHVAKGPAAARLTGPLAMFEPEHDGYKEVRDRLRFLHRKQQAYPGFDVHRTLHRLCAEELSHVRALTGSDAGADARAQALQRIGTLLEGMDRTPERFEIESLAVDPAHWAEWVRRNLESLRMIDALVESHISDSRRRLGGAFAQFAAGVAREHRDKAPPGAKFIFVTHGYSKSVRDALVHFFRDDAATHLAVSAQPRPRVLVMGHEEDNTIDDARKMVFQLRERLSGASIADHEVANGDEKALVGLLRRGDLVMVVLGAEAYDEERVVHPRGAQRHVEEISKRCTGKSVSLQTCIVAESYKKHEDLIDGHRLFRYHLYRLDVYELADIDSVISETGARRTARPRPG